MKGTTISIMTLFAFAIQPAESRDTGAHGRITVCVDSAMVIQTGYAEAIASTIFAGIGLKLDWRHGSRCPEAALMIRLTVNTPPTFMPGSFAYALPFQGSNIRVFYDRVSDPQLFAKSVVPKILGHVFAHEIGHMLQGITRHSETGVMKAHWTAGDYQSMAFRPLRFTEEDARLILAGLPQPRRN